MLTDRRMGTKKIAVILGTRPEAVKLAPVILAFRQSPGTECQVCVTGQHREMLDQALSVFDIVPDVDLDLMRPGQELADLTSRAVSALDAYLGDAMPDLVVVQGDTTTAFCGALSAFYRRIPVAHVEAGLRTGNRESPWPEEVNRLLIARVTDLHFAPTEWGRDNLLKEGIPPEGVSVTGNTVIDALFLALGKNRGCTLSIDGLPREVRDPESSRQVVLVTGHRRENFGDGLESICRAVAALAARFPEVAFVYPVHLNPRVREPVERCLRGIPNVYLTQPLPYLPFIMLMERSHIVLTDSGGLQEEAPSLGKPVLLMRDTTERPEAVEAGTVELVGTDYDAIVAAVTRLLTDETAYSRMARAHNPYGDGRAAYRIVHACEELLRQ